MAKISRRSHAKTYNYNGKPLPYKWSVLEKEELEKRDQFKSLIID